MHTPLLAAAFVLCLAACDDGPAPGTCDDVSGAQTGLGDADTATYAVVMIAEWIAATHPTDFPSDPHFSPLVALSHAAGEPFFERGATATAGMETMAERGPTSPLDDELTTLIDAGDAHALQTGSRIDSPGTDRVTLEATQEHAAITAVSMIAPSPDWFAAAQDVALRDDNGWLDAIAIDASAWDAGTDDGASFESADADTSPQGTIEPLDAAAVSGSDAPFVRWLLCRTG